jgi:hypothetical protein
LTLLFGNGGSVVVTMMPDGLSFQDVSVRASDNAITVAGWTTSSSGNAQIVLARFDATGASDPAFGSGGLVLSSSGSDWNVALSFAVQADGNIVVVGGRGDAGQWDRSDFLVGRFCP